MDFLVRFPADFKPLPNHQGVLMREQSPQEALNSLPKPLVKKLFDSLIRKMEKRCPPAQPE